MSKTIKPLREFYDRKEISLPEKTRVSKKEQANMFNNLQAEIDHFTDKLHKCSQEVIDSTLDHDQRLNFITLLVNDRNRKIKELMNDYKELLN